MRLVAIILIIAAMGAGPATQPSTKPRAVAPAIDLSFDSDRSVLTVTLTNGGKRPIIVDRELVIALSFSFYDADDERIDDEPTDDPRPVFGEPEKRFITLDPGQSLARVIDLSEPIRFFDYGHLTYLRGQLKLHRPFGREIFSRLPAGAAIKRVGVAYVTREFDFPPAFRVYTGMTLNQAGLYGGTLHRRLELDEEWKVPPTTAPSTQPVSENEHGTG
jgi:hypothetical protein